MIVFPFFIALLMNSVVMVQDNMDIEGVYASANDETTQLFILVDGYAAITTYTGDEYISTFGGPYEYRENQVIVALEFDDKHPDNVGSNKTFNLLFTSLDFTDASGATWEKVGSAHELDGAWQFKGRYKDGEYIEAAHRGSRKTIKLLKDGYFQWIAIDPAQKGFYGTGGGKYTYDKGTYTEHILFFSRDNTRIGAELSFDGELKEGDWHHSGFSSKGNALHEVWMRD